MILVAANTFEVVDLFVDELPVRASGKRHYDDDNDPKAIRQDTARMESE